MEASFEMAYEVQYEYLGSYLDVMHITSVLCLQAMPLATVPSAGSTTYVLSCNLDDEDVPDLAPCTSDDESDDDLDLPPHLTSDSDDEDDFDDEDDSFVPFLTGDCLDLVVEVIMYGWFLVMLFFIILYVCLYRASMIKGATRVQRTTTLVL